MTRSGFESAPSPPNGRRAPPGSYSPAIDSALRARVADIVAGEPLVRAALVPALCLVTAPVQNAPLGLHLTTSIPFGNYPCPRFPDSISGLCGGTASACSMATADTGRRPSLLVAASSWWIVRSEEHTSELQSLTNLVCRLLLEKKNI